MNYEHKMYLVQAEYHRVLGNFAEAIEAYDQAIASARKNEYLQEEALANEMAARFYQDWGKEKIAQAYLIDAYYLYIRWGAKAKVLDLEQRYAKVLASFLNNTQNQNRNSLRTKTSTSETFTERSSMLDLTTIEKASYALMGEIQLDKLLSRLIQIVNENAGAENCMLILPQGDSWVISAYSLGREASVFLQSTPLEESHNLPQTIINYVLQIGRASCRERVLMPV